MINIKKVKVAHTRLLIPVLGSQPVGDVSHKPGGRLPLLSARPAVTPAALKRAAASFAAWWTEAQWVWTVCPRLRLQFEPGPFCARVQHANHSMINIRTNNNWLVYLMMLIWWHRRVFDLVYYVLFCQLSSPRLNWNFRLCPVKFCCIVESKLLWKLDYHNSLHCTV